MANERSRSTWVSLATVFVLSAATLLFEINLTRLFAVAQFYHFAFMVVSLALLGFGASGTILATFPSFGKKDPIQSIGIFSLGSAVTILGAYLFINWVPFDSFSMAWEFSQVWIFMLHYLILSLPFFFSGLATGLLLAIRPEQSSRTYAVNLIGSAVGCALALLSPNLLGGVGTVLLCSALAALGGLFVLLVRTQEQRNRLLAGISVTVIVLILALLFFWITDQPSVSFLVLQLSPYKSLSYALQYPQAEIIAQEWNAFSRVDLVNSQGIRSLPGLSYQYTEALPSESGLFVDGGELSPVVVKGENLAFADYLPGMVAYDLQPDARTLILEPRGGVDILVAEAGGANHITAVESNRLIVEFAEHIYKPPDVEVVVESDRSFVRRDTNKYDVIVLSLPNSYHPVRSGAYSLAEDYRYTAESFQDTISHLEPEGILVISRWLQVPPSEWLRVFALAVTALEREGLDPTTRIVAFRSFNIGVLLVKENPFSEQELLLVRDFTAQRAYDMVYAPDIHPGEVNQFNVMPESVYYEAFTGLLHATDRPAWYREYPYDVTPPTDNKPFFSHYFQWSQSRRIIAELGKTWQPFGGAGYFVLLVLLAITIILAVVLILTPLIVGRLIKHYQNEEADPQSVLWPALLYFFLIGLGFFFIEIPLIQQFILFLGQPAYALTIVLFSILFFSGLGSRFSDRFPHRIMLISLIVLVLLSPIVLPIIFDQALKFSLGFRLLVGVGLLAPLGFLMGIPFPGGLQRLERSSNRIISWVWGVNGVASVVSSVLAVLLAMSFGFRWVLLFGAFCYIGAFLVAPQLSIKVR